MLSCCLDVAVVLMICLLNDNGNDDDDDDDLPSSMDGWMQDEGK